MPVNPVSRAGMDNTLRKLLVAQKLCGNAIANPSLPKDDLLAYMSTVVLGAQASSPARVERNQLSSNRELPAAFSRSGLRWTRAGGDACVPRTMMLFYSFPVR